LIAADRHHHGVDRAAVATKDHPDGIGVSSPEGLKRRLHRIILAGMARSTGEEASTTSPSEQPAPEQSQSQQGTMLTWLNS
jgi:hypothetical protein